jgi:hypothetical protein
VIVSVVTVAGCVQMMLYLRVTRTGLLVLLLEIIQNSAFPSHFVQSLTSSIAPAATAAALTHSENTATLFQAFKIFMGYLLSSDSFRRRKPHSSVDHPAERV